MTFSANIAELVEASTAGLHAAARWWRRVPLGQVADVLNGYPFDSKFFSDESGARLVRIRDVTTGETSTFYRGPVPEGFWIERGDTIVGMDGDFNLRVWNAERGLLNQRVCKITADRQVLEPAFLALVLPGYLRLINEHTHSVTVKHLSSRTLQQVPLPIPPLAEQRRIVARVEAVFARIRRARGDLERVGPLVRHCWQRLLEKAFSSELTESWRREAASKAVGTWAELPMSELADIASGQTPKEIERHLRADGDIHWFKVSSMNAVSNSQALVTSDHRLSQEGAASIKLKMFEPGAIVFPKRGGAIATNKKRRMGVRGGLDLNLMALTPRAVEGDYLWWWVQKLDLSTLSDGSNVPQINHGDIAPLSVPVPCRAEQSEVSRRLSVAHELIQTAEAEAGRGLTLLDRLEQAVLAKAFRGELVRQDPTDEPAEALLARLQPAATSRRRRAGAAPPA